VILRKQARYCSSGVPVVTKHANGTRAAWDDARSSPIRHRHCEGRPTGNGICSDFLITSFGI
jgi:hypothetical protein